MFDLCAGFVYSQVLLACVQLDLFELLKDEPKTLSELAGLINLSEQSTQRLLDAAVSLDLINRRSHNRYGLGSHGAALLGNPGVIAMIKHHPMLYRDLADPVAMLKAEKGNAELASYWNYTDEKNVTAAETDKVSAYSALMSASQPLVAEQILDAYSFKPHRCLLDVGGGDGTFLAAVAAKEPHLRLMLFDLPAVAAKAKEKLHAAGLEERSQVHGGSFLNDALPRGADIISLVRIIHDHNDPEALTILKAASQALEPGGQLLLAEPMSDVSGTEPMSDAYFGFYLMAMGRGRPRNLNELSNLLEQAGFGELEIRATHIPLQTSLIIASKV